MAKGKVFDEMTQSTKEVLNLGFKNSNQSQTESKQFTSMRLDPNKTKNQSKLNITLSFNSNNLQPGQKQNTTMNPNLLRGKQTSGFGLGKTATRLAKGRNEQCKCWGTKEVQMMVMRLCDRNFVFDVS